MQFTLTIHTHIDTDTEFSTHFRSYVYSVARDCDSGKINPKVCIISFHVVAD